MPEIKRPEVYKATFSAAKKVFERDGALEPFSMKEREGVFLYRYVSYRRGQPQEVEAARKIWNSLEKDTSNRWTGLGFDQSGSQGLYMSGERIQEHKPFPELEHYQAPTENSSEEIKIKGLRFEPGSEHGIPDEFYATELRTLYMFSVEGIELTGRDFSLQVKGQDHPLLTEILDLVKESNPGVLSSEDSLRSLYLSSDDASFTRAIGNALFEVDTVDFFQAISVRDEKSHNIILRAKYGIPIDYLKGVQRFTFVVDKEGNRGVMVQTEDDKSYTNGLMKRWIDWP